MDKFKRQLEQTKRRYRRFENRRRQIYKEARELGYTSYEADAISRLSNKRMEECGLNPKDFLKEE